jgi:hypothetical protein
MEEGSMKTLVTSLIALTLIALAPTAARAHCDAVDGPVASAALKALDEKNVNVVLPYAPAAAEAELTAAFKQALAVRTKDAEARALADRYFMETAVRLHRAGEKAPYTGLKPAGQDFGPAIPAAERALETGTLAPVVQVLEKAMAHGLEHRFHPLADLRASKTPATHADVQAARERVSAELGFVGYVEGLYQATRGAAHAE